MNSLLILLPVLGLTAAGSLNLPLDEAISQQKITASAFAAENSAHYQQPVVLEMKNITSSPMVIEIPVGRLFQSGNIISQNFVSTEPLMAALDPGEVKKNFPFGHVYQSPRGRTCRQKALSNKEKCR